jgi:Zincin-like metallopeptidase
MLPSGRVVGLVGLADEAPAPEETAAPGPPYAGALALLERGGVIVRSEGRPIEARALALCDFHALRAILARLGWLGETAVVIECRNCKEKISHWPCSALELGPFVDRELHHPDLDAMLDLGVAHPIPHARVMKQTASTLTLRALSLGEALPLHAALGRRRLVIDEAVVKALGVAALGDARGPAAIGRALARCSEATFLALEALFVQAHYPPRLFSIAKCGACGARNDVDAPYDREFAVDLDARGPVPGTKAAHPYRELRGTRSEGREVDPPPTFEAFDAKARELFSEASAGAAEHGVALIVDGDVPACDDGGEPLLGSYTPPYEGDPATPSRSAQVAVFYRTFLAIWEEDGPYDWCDELRETVEHELEHHAGYRRGHDEVDVEERRAIDAEAVELIGQRQTARLVVGSFAHDFGGFLRRTWPLWVLVAIGTALTIAMGR